MTNGSAFSLLLFIRLATFLTVHEHLITSRAQISRHVAGLTRLISAVLMELEVGFYH